MGLFLPTSPSLCFAFTHAHSLSYNSPSILSPDLDSHGVRFKARWTERFFSPMTVVLLTSHSRVPWENSGAEGLSFSEN